MLMKSIEIFAGAGGLAIGIHLAGFRHTALVDQAPNAIKTLQRNIQEQSLGIAQWNGKVYLEDVRNIHFKAFGPVDLVGGGPPCQPFSIGGKHRGMEDDRDMIPQFIRAIRELEPRAFIMENVKGLLRPCFESYMKYSILKLQFPTIEQDHAEPWEAHMARLVAYQDKGFQGVSYRVTYQLLNAAKFGVPQTRERVFIVGFRMDTGIQWEFPPETHSQDQLLFDQWVTGAYWHRHKVKAPDSPPATVAKRVERLRSGSRSRLKPWKTVRDALHDLPNPMNGNGGFHNHTFQPGARSYIGHTGSQYDWPSKTLKAGDHGVPGGENMIAFADGSVRYFTAREAARIQTFPDSWHLEGAWTQTLRQLGNAVPVELAALIAKSVAEKMS